MDSLCAIEARVGGVDENALAFVMAKLASVQPYDNDASTLSSPLTGEDLKAKFLHQADQAYNDIPNLSAVTECSPEELLFWTNLVNDYRTTATVVPKYTSLMVRAGVPAPLRGVVWPSLAEASVSSSMATLSMLYDSLAAEWTPFVKIIGRDLNRTFPEISLFREAGGAGQQMLGRVLRAYSTYDMQVGYCQGLTFLAGPLLLHMDDRQAFCVLVRLMEDHGLRSMFTADMSGLHLRMFQFERLLEDHLPQLAAHFSSIGVPSIYASQWFLSFYAVTCPLAMLVRIYDLILAEGAIPTLMRVGLAVLQRNEKRLLALDDEGEILQTLLSSSLWQVYGSEGANVLVTDMSHVPADLLQSLADLDKAYSQAKKPSSRGSRGHQAAGRSRLATALSNMPWAASSLFSRFSSSEHTLAMHRSESKVSVSSESDDSCASSVSSYTMETDTKLDQLRAELESVKAMLEAERHQRQVDRAQVIALLDILPNDASVQACASVLKQRLRIQHGESGPECSSCEYYMMELAAAKSNLTLATAELDNLKDSVVEGADRNKTWGLWK